MKLNIYTVYDAKAHTYTQPMFFLNEAVALRVFANAANDKSSYLNAAPGDYSFFHLGEWDDDTAAITTLAAPHCLGLASQFINKDNDK